MPSMRSTSIEDVFNLYVGCRCRFTYNDGTICEFINPGSAHGGIFASNLLYDNENPFEYHVQDVELYFDDIREDEKLQLFLLRTCDMSENQKKEYNSLLWVNDFDGFKWSTDTPESLLFLFKNKINCFNLIERGLAISLVEHETETYIFDLTIRRAELAMDICNADNERVGEWRKFIKQKNNEIIEINNEIKSLKQKSHKCPICSDTGFTKDLKTGEDRPCVLCKKAMLITEHLK